MAFSDEQQYTRILSYVRSCLDMLVVTCALHARCGEPPDVWRQLVRRLLNFPPCCQELIKHSSGPAAAAAAAAPEMYLSAQLKDTLAQEVVASIHAAQK
jgi:hypothetical protein